MKTIKYNFDEEIYESTLDNGLKIYLYPTNKTKNFYITVSTHFGSEVMSYKKGDKKYEVTKGSAHFLEHRVMDFTKNKDAMEKINEFGSIVNAYTTYNGTNYNLFGHDNIYENMELLFDRVFKADIKKEDVENERGIILEEYNMYFDDPYFLLHNNLNQNIFQKSFIKYPVLGTKEGIETVTVAQAQVEERVTALVEEDEKEKENESKKVNGILLANLPVNGTITSRYGVRNPTVSTVSKFHTGLDIGTTEGTDIISATDGKVILHSTTGDYGKHLKIEKDDVIIIYAHCSKLLVNEGEEVRQGQKIAEVGSTGNSTGPHLHFEIRKSGRYIDPQLILNI